MPEKKRTFEAEVNGAKPLKLQTRQVEQDAELGSQPHFSRRKTRPGQSFSRDVVVRLIDWMKQD